MAFFKKKIIKDIGGATWGRLVNDYNIDVDTLSHHMRCVEREGLVGNERVTLVRIFRPKDAEKKGVVVTGWETFDQHRDLLAFEGYVTRNNEAHIQRVTNPEVAV